MNRAIEVKKVLVSDNTISYEVYDNTGLNLLKGKQVEAWVKYHNVESFNFSLKDIPEPILLMPITLYMLPVTWFYGVNIVVSSVDKTLYDNIPAIYAAYSKLYGPFKKEWRGKLVANEVVDCPMPESRYDNVVFFSGGVDAIHASIDYPGKRSVLVSVPSIESMEKRKLKNVGTDFLDVKIQLIRNFSAVVGSDWLVVTNNFLADVFDDVRIKHDLKTSFSLDTPAFRFDGWFGIKYLGNLLSAAPFAYAMGIKNLVLGSAFEMLENKPASNLDCANPELSDAFKFSGVSFTEQDALCVRRSQKVKNIVDWGSNHGKKLKLRTCFSDSNEQCGKCVKCIRTQLNILCAKANPKDWGFDRFDEKRFSRLVRSYYYNERNMCWFWDIMDSIDDRVNYPYCNDLLHWFKRLGYRKYSKRARLVGKMGRFIRFYKYPYYVQAVFQKVLGK